MAKLNLLNDRTSPQDFKGAVKFHYPSAERPNPTVLPLGTFTHPRTKNELMAGLNLDMMSPGEIERLKKTQKSIFNKSDLPDRYWTARRANPAAMERTYRTYDLGEIDRVTPVKSTAKAADNIPRNQPPAGTVSSIKPDQWAASEPEFFEPDEPVAAAPAVPELPVVDNGFVHNEPRNLNQTTPQEVAGKPTNKQDTMNQPVTPPAQPAAPPAQPAQPAIAPQLGAGQSQIPSVVPPNMPNAIDGAGTQIHSSPALSQSPAPQQPVAGNTVQPAGDANSDDIMERELDQLFSGDNQWDKTQSNSVQPTSGTAQNVKPRIG